VLESVRKLRDDDHLRPYEVARCIDGVLPAAFSARREQQRPRLKINEADIAQPEKSGNSVVKHHKAVRADVRDKGEFATTSHARGEVRDGRTSEVFAELMLSFAIKEPSVRIAKGSSNIEHRFDVA
jgi:hypothetical protein